MNRNSKGGFTLVEAMIAGAIGAVVLGYLAITLVSSQRLLQETMGDMELSLSGRMLREKLLFRINEDGGFLSAKKSKIPLLQHVPVNSVSYTPYDASANTVKSSSGNQLFTATKAMSSLWFSQGTITLGEPKVFTYSNNTVIASMDLILAVGNRTYRQPLHFEAPALCMLPTN